jgi:hypothetical protein
MNIYEIKTISSNEFTIKDNSPYNTGNTLGSRK